MKLYGVLVRVPILLLASTAKTKGAEDVVGGKPSSKCGPIPCKYETSVFPRVLIMLSIRLSDSSYRLALLSTDELTEDTISRDLG